MDPADLVLGSAVAVQNRDAKFAEKRARVAREGGMLVVFDSRRRRESRHDSMRRELKRADQSSKAGQLFCYYRQCDALVVH